jgi:hypothetical protein
VDITPEELRFMAVHEAGHAVVAMALGMDVIEIAVNPDGGRCIRPEYHPPQSFHAYTALGGYFATAMYARDCNNAWLTWSDCKEDLERFNRTRMGATYRHGRRVVVQILRDKKAKVLHLAELLMKHRLVNGDTEGADCP